MMHQSMDFKDMTKRQILLLSTSMAPFAEIF